MLKRITKKGVYRLTAARDEKAILEQVADKTVVSFDVFDTAVKRDMLSPEDIFTLIADKLKAENGDIYKDFVRHRIEAERSARASADGREVTLEEIYTQMPVSEEQRQRLLQLECETELAVSVPNLPIKRVYSTCVQQGKKILFISDIYLSPAVVERILKKNGYTQGKLYASSESGSTKRSGKLFEYVQKAEDLSIKDWAHIGDAIMADYLVPRKLGIRAILIEHEPRYNPYVQKRLYRNNQSYRQLNHFIDVHIPRYTNPYEQIGYAVLGPLLYGFACWLKEEIPEEESIVFLAREGKLLQKAFQIISDRQSIYLQASRHALNIVRIDRAGNVKELLEEGIDSIKRYSKQLVWAKMYGLADGETETVFQSKGLDMDAVVTNEEMKRQLLKAIWPTAKKNAQGQFDVFETYIARLGIGNKAALIDVGWKGTMQAFLSNMALKSNGRPIQWTGYYLGVVRQGTMPPYSRYSKKAYLFDGKTNIRNEQSVENSCHIFETLFLSTEGTTKGYKATSDGAGPVLSEFKSGKDMDGMILAMQKAGLAFVEDYWKSPVGGSRRMDVAIAIANYEAMAREPKIKTIKLFERFTFYDEKVVDFGTNLSLGQYLCHPKRLFADFVEAGNKSWFLKSVFKIPLPYIAIISFAKKATEKKKI